MGKLATLYLSAFLVASITLSGPLVGVAVAGNTGTGNQPLDSDGIYWQGQSLSAAGNMAGETWTRLGGIAPTFNKNSQRHVSQS